VVGEGGRCLGERVAGLDRGGELAAREQVDELGGDGGAAPLREGAERTLASAAPSRARAIARMSAEIAEVPALRATQAPAPSPPSRPAAVKGLTESKGGGAINGTAGSPARG
jgi:hypothetical protein